MKTEPAIKSSESSSPLAALALGPREWRAACALLVIFCLGHVYELANFNISIDDEYLAHTHVCHFADVGRWLHPLVRWWWPQPVVPAAPLLIFGACLSLGFVYMARLLGVRRLGPAHHAVFAAFALYPVWMAQLEFAGNVLPVGMGVLACCAAALLACQPANAPRRGRWLRAAAGVLLVAVATGAYQSLNLLFFVLALAGALAAALLPATPDWPGCRARLRRAVLWCLAGTALSLLLAHIVMLACGVTPSDYARQFFHPEALLQAPGQVLSFFFHDAVRGYGSFWKSFAPTRGVFTAAVLACLALCLWRARGRGMGRVGLLLLALLFSPAAYVLVAGETLTLRTYMASAAVVGSLLLLAHGAASRPAARRLVVVLALLVALQSLYVNAVQQARGWAVQKRDQALAAAIYQAVTRLRSADSADSAGGQPPLFLHFQGGLPFDSIYPAARTVTQGASFFEWDGGDPSRIVYYMRMLGYSDVLPEDGIAAQELAAAYAVMPVWPADGSVRRHGRAFLVKLSEPANAARVEGGQRP